MVFELSEHRESRWVLSQEGMRRQTHESQDESRKLAALDRLPLLALGLPAGGCG